MVHYLSVYVQDLVGWLIQNSLLFNLINNGHIINTSLIGMGLGLSTCKMRTIVSGK